MYNKTHKDCKMYRELRCCKCGRKLAEVAGACDALIKCARCHSFNHFKYI